MIRVVVYSTKLENIIKSVNFYKDVEELKSNLSKDLFNEDLSLFKIVRELELRNEDILIDYNYPDGLKSNLEDYVGSYISEINIVQPSFGIPITSCIKLTDFQLDSDSVTSFINLPVITEIIGSDDEVKKLIDQISFLGASWDILFNYLSEVYNIKVVNINYISSLATEDEV